MRKKEKKKKEHFHPLHPHEKYADYVVILNIQNCV